MAACPDSAAMHCAGCSIDHGMLFRVSKWQNIQGVGRDLRRAWRCRRSKGQATGFTTMRGVKAGEHRRALRTAQCTLSAPRCPGNQWVTTATMTTSTHHYTANDDEAHCVWVWLAQPWLARVSAAVEREIRENLATKRTRTHAPERCTPHPVSAGGRWPSPASLPAGSRG